MALSIDGHAAAAWSGSSSGTVSLTTTHPNDLIVVVAAMEFSTGTHAIVNSVAKTSGTGTVGTFARRGSIYADSVPNTGFSTAPGMSLEYWWGVATTVLTGAVFTVQSAAAVDDAYLGAFAVNFDSVNVPVWTSNASCPKSASNITSVGSVPTVAGISTNAAAILLGLMLTSHNSVNTIGSGYAMIDAAVNTGGTNQMSFDEEEQLFAALQSGISVPFGTSVFPWFMLADAIEAPAVGGMPPAAPLLPNTQLWYSYP